jgi:hypothetical protein
MAHLPSQRANRTEQQTVSLQRRVVHAVYEGAEFNALLGRLPRAVRRTVEPAPPGELGLIVEVVSADDCTLTSVFAHVPPATDVTRELSRMEARALTALE